MFCIRQGQGVGAGATALAPGSARHTHMQDCARIGQPYGLGTITDLPSSKCCRRVSTDRVASVGWPGRDMTRQDIVTSRRVRRVKAVSTAMCSSTLQLLCTRTVSASREVRPAMPGVLPGSSTKAGKPSPAGGFSSASMRSPPGPASARLVKLPGRRAKLAVVHLKTRSLSACRLVRLLRPVRQTSAVRGPRICSAVRVRQVGQCVSKLCRVARAAAFYVEVQALQSCEGGQALQAHGVLLLGEVQAHQARQPPGALTRNSLTCRDCSPGRRASGSSSCGGGCTQLLLATLMLVRLPPSTA